MSNGPLSPVVHLHNIHEIMQKEKCVGEQHDPLLILINFEKWAHLKEKTIVSRCAILILRTG